jgi:hypothetical protein
VARNPRQTPPLGPAPVAIHDYGDVLWQPVAVYPRQQLRLGKFWFHGRLQDSE